MGLSAVSACRSDVLLNMHKDARARSAVHWYVYQFESIMWMMSFMKDCVLGVLNAITATMASFIFWYPVIAFANVSLSAYDRLPHWMNGLVSLWLLLSWPTRISFLAFVLYPPWFASRVI